MLDKLKDLWNRWNVHVAVVGGVLVIGATWGTCTYEPNLGSEEVQEESEAAPQAEDASTETTGTEETTETTETTEATSATETTTTE